MYMMTRNFLLSFVFLVVGIGVLTGTLRSVERSKQDDIRDQIAVSEPGKFAMLNLRDCMTSSSLFSERKSQAECINTVVTAARNLKGDMFAASVANSLNTWVEKSDGTSKRD
jgi:hypothetical protein